MKEKTLCPIKGGGAALRIRPLPVHDPDHVGTHIERYVLPRDLSKPPNRLKL